MDRFNTKDDSVVTFKSIATDIVYSDSSKKEQVDLIINAQYNAYNGCKLEMAESVTMNEKTFKALKTELSASKIMFGSDAYAQGWNDAMAKALNFIKMYSNGEGLFQQ